MNQFHHSVPISSVNGGGSIMLFDLDGHRIRFGMTENGRPYAVASDFAKAMGYAKTQNATDILDEDEKGHAQVVTPGGLQRLAVVFEDGLWEMIFRSILPGAKALKKQVKEILRRIRETGRYEAPGAMPPVPQDYEEALVHLLDKVRENKALAAANKILAPKAGKWDEFLSAEGLIGMRETADLFHVDVRVLTGWLVDINIFRRQVSRSGGARNLPRKAYQDSDHFTVRVETKNGFRFPAAYVTGDGLDLIDDLWKKRSAA